MKRFYKQVTTTSDCGVMLDNRPVRTPAKLPLILPNIALTEAVAEEWREQADDIAPHLMPLTGLANAAIDRVTRDPEAFAGGLSAYAESELLCYRAGDPPALVARQNKIWDPILHWAGDRFNVTFTRVTGIMHQPQPRESLDRLTAAIAARTPWELAALSPLVTISGSLIIPLALADEAVLPEAAFDAAHLDELWQAEQWGEDDFALEARAVHRRDFLAAARFLDLLRG